MITGTFHRLEQGTDELVPVEQMWKSGSIAQLIEHFLACDLQDTSIILDLGRQKEDTWKFKVILSYIGNWWPD